MNNTINKTKLLEAVEQGIDIFFGIAPNGNHLFHPIKRVIYTRKPVSYTHLTLPTILRV